MKKNKGFLLGFMSASLVFFSTMSVLGKISSTTIPVKFDNIKITLDGNLIATSNEPFIYNSVTYLPVRDVARATGKTVSWDSATKTVQLWNAESQDNGIILSDGNYKAGKDFPAGKYNIVCIEGSGNVSSSNIFSGGINESMASKEEIANSILSSSYISEFKNCNLPKETTLRVSGGVTIKLINAN